MFFNSACSLLLRVHLHASPPPPPPSQVMVLILSALLSSSPAIVTAVPPTKESPTCSPDFVCFNGGVCKTDGITPFCRWEENQPEGAKVFGSRNLLIMETCIIWKLALVRIIPNQIQSPAGLRCFLFLLFFCLIQLSGILSLLENGKRIWLDLHIFRWDVSIPTYSTLPAQECSSARSTKRLFYQWDKRFLMGCRRLPLKTVCDTCWASKLPSTPRQCPCFISQLLGSEFELIATWRPAELQSRATVNWIWLWRWMNETGTLSLCNLWDAHFLLWKFDIASLQKFFSWKRNSSVTVSQKKKQADQKLFEPRQLERASSPHWQCMLVCWLLAFETLTHALLHQKVSVKQCWDTCMVDEKWANRQSCVEDVDEILDWAPVAARKSTHPQILKKPQGRNVRLNTVSDLSVYLKFFKTVLMTHRLPLRCRLKNTKYSVG